MFDNMNTTTQGNVGLGLAIAYFVSRGYVVSLPLNDNQGYDLIVDDGNLQRVQVKTTATIPKNKKNYVVQLKSVRANRSCNKIKNFDATKCELLFVLTEKDDKYLIPSMVVDGYSALSLSAKMDKYRI